MQIIDDVHRSGDSAEKRNKQCTESNRSVRKDPFPFHATNHSHTRTLVLPRTSEHSMLIIGLRGCPRGNEVKIKSMMRLGGVWRRWRCRALNIEDAILRIV